MVESNFKINLLNKRAKSLNHLLNKNSCMYLGDDVINNRCKI